MKIKMLGLLAIILHIQAFGQSYKVELDVSTTANDQIPVIVYPPASSDKTVEYHVAKIVPGTYEISDFGRFVTDFKAFDTTGNELTVEKLTTNRWKIPQNGKLEKITYNVHDTRDPFEGYDKDSRVIFEPGGTDFDTPLYLMNTFGIIGYIDGMKDLPYELSIKHAPYTYGATALKRTSSTDSIDVFSAEDFNFLADGPIMYCMPDTTSKKIANAEILVSVFSPNQILTSKAVMENIDDLMEAQSDYLGGQLPVDRYAYLINLFDDETMSGAYGALEHSYSSLYSLPERAGDRISQIVRDVAAHEFFHIVTPLNIHAEQIGNFDYIEPKMSKHLWLYEGVTEYSSMHVQVRYDLYSPEKFLEEIEGKMSGADQFPQDVSFTEMSERILEPEFEPMYRNVYEKGALIGMCLDLFIIKHSNGEKDLPWLMRELSKKYGKEVSFKDDELFDVIESLTYPEVGAFLRTYVEGSEPLPFDEVLSWVGVDYAPAEKTKTISAGNISFGLDGDNNIMISDVSRMNEFGEDLGLEKGDILIEVKGMELKLENVSDVMSAYKDETTAGEKVTFKVKRENKRGKVKTKKLKAKAIEVDTWTKHDVSFSEDPTDEQQKLLKAWISAE